MEDLLVLERVEVPRGSRDERQTNVSRFRPGHISSEKVTYFCGR